MSEDWRAPLFARRNAGMKFDLESLRAVDAALGHPARAARHVQVLGTNGKGSTSAMIAWALQKAGQQAGRRVGLFTSPHLHRAGERVRVNFLPATDAELRFAIERVLEHEGAAGRTLSFFELLTLAALVHFGAAGVEDIVLEAGLGGRLDSTSLRRADHVALTSVAMDHQAFLGPDLASIAGEKLGALDAEQVLWTVAQAPEVEAVLATRPFRRAAPVSASLPTVLPGPHQRINAGLARALVEGMGEPWPSESGWAEFRWPGRYEARPHLGGVMIFDVAHNPHAMDALLEAATTDPAGPPDLIVWGHAADKEGEAMRAALTRLECERWWAGPVGPRGQCNAGSRSTEARAFDDASSLELRAALESRLAGGARVLVCGSHFVVAPLRAWALGLGPLDMDPPELTDPVNVHGEQGPP